MSLERPYADALFTLIRLAVVLGLIPMTGGGLLYLWGKSSSLSFILMMIGGAFILLMLLAWIIIRIMSISLASKIRDFLGSNRPLVRWTYTPDEWKDLREAVWQEEKGDWRIQLGCLTAIFCITGLLTGVLIGLDKGGMEAVICSGAGAGIGMVVGGFIGAAVSRINYRISMKKLQNPVPAQVALGPHELLFEEDYFKGNSYSKYVYSAAFDKEYGPSTLVIRLQWPRFRQSSEQEWVITVPARMRRSVEAVLPRIADPAGIPQEDPIDLDS